MQLQMLGKKFKNLNFILWKSCDRRYIIFYEKDVGSVCLENNMSHIYNKRIREVRIFLVKIQNIEELI